MLASSLERTPFYFPAPTFLSFFFLFLRDPKIRSKKDIRVFQGQDFCYQYQKWLHLQACKIGSRPLEEKFFGMSSGPGYLVIRIHLAICFWSLHSWRYSKAIWTLSQATIPWWPCLSSEGWTRSLPEIPSNLNHPLSSWACEPISSSLVSLVPVREIVCVMQCIDWEDVTTFLAQKRILW